jgi:hypothetical protein
MDGHSSIHFIQNLMLNSNLKSDIQKNFQAKRLRPKRSDLVPNYHVYYNYLSLKKFLKFVVNCQYSYVSKLNALAPENRFHLYFFVNGSSSLFII